MKTEHREALMRIATRHAELIQQLDRVNRLLEKLERGERFNLVMPARGDGEIVYYPVADFMDAQVNRIHVRDWCQTRLVEIRHLLKTTDWDATEPPAEDPPHGQTTA